MESGTGRGVTFRTDPSGWAEERFNYGIDQFENWTSAPDVQSSFQNDGDETLSILALLSASAGVTNQREIWGALLAHLVWYLGQNKGVDAMYSFLAGVLVYKKRYVFAAFPTFKDVADIQSKEMYTWAFKNGLWACGYLAAMYRYV